MFVSKIVFWRIALRSIGLIIIVIIIVNYSQTQQQYNETENSFRQFPISICRSIVSFHLI